MRVALRKAEEREKGLKGVWLLKDWVTPERLRPKSLTVRPERLTVRPERLVVRCKENNKKGMNQARSVQVVDASLPTKLQGVKKWRGVEDFKSFPSQHTPFLQWAPAKFQGVKGG